jgi:hypothetical protein
MTFGQLSDRAHRFHVITNVMSSVFFGGEILPIGDPKKSFAKAF